MIPFLIAALASFIGSFILIPVLLGLLRLFGLYTMVEEGSATCMCCSARWRRSSTSPGCISCF